MGETIDLNDLSNIEESFTNVKMFGGVAPGAKNNRDFQPGTQVLHQGDVWEFVKYDEKDSRYLIIKRDDEEIRVYNQSVIIYEPPPKSTPMRGNSNLSFSPKSPIETYQYSPGDVVLYLGNRWEVVKIDEGDSRYVIIKRDGEEKRVYHLDLIIYEPPSPRSPDGPPPQSPDEPIPGPRTPSGTPPPSPDEPIPGPRSPSGTPPPSPDDEPIPGPRSPDDEPIPGPRSPDELPPAGPRSPDELPPAGPRSPDELPPAGPRSPDELPPAGPRSPDELPPPSPEPRTPVEPKVSSDTDLLKLLDSLQTKNLPTVKLVKSEELVEDPTREETGVYKATNKLLSRIHSADRENYLRKINELNALIRKNKAGLSVKETDRDITYTFEDVTEKIDKPMYRNVSELLSNLNRDLEMIEYELREKREQAILNPDPKLNREIQKLNERYKLYSQSLEVYHQYYSLVNKVPENKSKINSLSAKRNENRVEQIRLFSEIAETMNHGTYDNDALNTIITEYLSRGTRDIEEQLRETREADKVEHLILNDYSITSKAETTEEKPKKRVIKKKGKKQAPKKKKQEKLLDDVLTTLEEAAVATEEPAGATEEPVGAPEEVASGDYSVTPDTLIKGKPVPLDGKKQFKEEEEIREKCSENEDCKGFTEKTYSDGKVKYFPRDSQKTVPGKDHRAFLKTSGGLADIADQVTEVAESPDSGIKTIKINTPMIGGGTETQQKPEEEKPQEVIELNDIEEIDLPDDIESLMPEEQDYSFIGSYDSDENDSADANIPIELTIVKRE